MLFRMESVIHSAFQSEKSETLCSQHIVFHRECDKITPEHTIKPKKYTFLKVEQ